MHTGFEAVKNISTLFSEPQNAPKANLPPDGIINRGVKTIEMSQFAAFCLARSRIKKYHHTVPFRGGWGTSKACQHRGGRYGRYFLGRKIHFFYKQFKGDIFCNACAWRIPKSWPAAAIWGGAALPKKRQRPLTYIVSGLQRMFVRLPDRFHWCCTTVSLRSKPVSGLFMRGVGGIFCFYYSLHWLRKKQQ